MKRSWTRALRAAAVGAAAVMLVASCQSNPATTDGKIKLTINFWGDFGLTDLKTKYEASHPNIEVVLNSGEFNAQHELLQQKLVAGSGAPDIAAIDEGFIVSFRSQADKFVNLLDKGAGSYESKYLPWKWKQSLSADGTQQIGLGTDVGGLAMCYRTDLFKDAGLPTDRDEVSKLWPDWDSFINVGKDYVAKSGKKFVDNATNIFNPVLAQQSVGFFDTSETLKLDGPKVAFDTSVKVIQAGLSANLASFSAGWDQGFVKGDFAVLACPAWMIGHIKDVAPATEGKWDIAAIPGGGGNWGGSFLTIPKQGQHVDEAYELLTWLVQPENQIEIFQKVGNLPSQPELYKDPAILDFKNPFMSNAPTGQIFASTAEDLQPQYLGLKHGDCRVAAENVLNEVQAGNVKPEDAWAAATTKIQEAAAA